MRSIYHIFFVGVLVTVGLSACHKSEQKNNTNSLAFDSLKLIKVYHLDNDSTKPSCNLKINFVFPVKGLSEKELAKVKANFISTVFDQAYADSLPGVAAQSYARDYVRTYKEDAKLFYDDVNESEEPQNYFSYYETLSNHILYNKHNLLSYQVEQLNYKGGTNSFTSFHNYVIDLKTGEFLSEDAIFNPGYERSLNPMFINKLLQMNNAKDISELEDLGYFGIDEIAPNSNFFVDDSGITYIFNKGEALSLGEIRIRFSYKELESLLKPNSPLHPLLKN